MLGLRAKVTLTFAVTFLAFLGALLFGIVRVQAVRTELTTVKEQYLPLVRSFESLEVPVRVPIDFEGYYRLPARDLPAWREPRKDRIQQALAETRQNLDNTLAQVQEPNRADIAEMIRIFAEIEAQVPEYIKEVDTFFYAIEQRDRDAALASHRRLERKRIQLLDTIETLKKANETARRHKMDVAASHASTILYALGGLTLLALLAAILASGFLAVSLRPLGELAERARDIGRGDFGGEVTVRPGAGSEVATLAAEFNQMTQRLRARDESLRALSIHLESIIEGIRAGLVVLNPAGKITRVNSAAEEIWGVDRQTLTDQNIDVLAGSDAFADRLDGVRSSGKVARVASVPVRTTTGTNGSGEEETTLVDITLVPFPDGVIVVADDVTERTQMERALLRSEKLAAIGRMSSQITHEVRNPLNSLSLNLELLEDELRSFGDSDTEEAWRIVKALSSEAERLNEVTEGYLGFARLPRPRLEKENLNDIVRGLLEFVREEVNATGVKLEVALSDDLLTVLADENQIRQALLNIIRNALEALSEVGGEDLRLRVSTRAVDGAVEAVIADTGPGIDVRDLDHIFDPLYSTKDTGTGVGLPITQQIIEEHDGTLSCESEKGKGTAFIVRFPRA